MEKKFKTSVNELQQIMDQVAFPVEEGRRMSYLSSKDMLIILK